jgi:hypothetical protein
MRKEAIVADNLPQIRFLVLAYCCLPEADLAPEPELGACPAGVLGSAACGACGGTAVPDGNGAFTSKFGKMLFPR